ncbi:hypothetical protein LINGRAHAP2_LOCUS15035 [Linum grandiflorum]
MDDRKHQSDDCVEIDGSEVWPEPVEVFLLDTMIDEMKKGYLVTSTFSKTGWSNIKLALKLKFNKDYDIKQLTNKYGQWRQRHKNFKKLIAQTGMGYTVSNGRVTAEPEVWAMVSKVSYNILKLLM